METAKPHSQLIRSPGDFLKQVMGQRVLVRLNSGAEIHGDLACLDGYMNIALEHVEEWDEGTRSCTHGQAFVRGNNGKGSAFAVLPANLFVPFCSTLYISVKVSKDM